MPELKAIELLMVGRMLPMVGETLERRFTLHRLVDQADPAAFLAAAGPRIRGIVSGPTSPVDKALIDHCPTLEIIANFGVGYDNVDAVHAGTRGIVVTNTPDVLTEEVADTALGLMIMTVRELGAAERHLRAGKWPDAPYPLTRASLRDRGVGIVGLGRIGKAIARRVEAFGMPVAYHNRNRLADVGYRYCASLVELAKTVDILMVVTPGGAATRHLIDADVLAALGPNGILINVGRGSVVDETALISALDAGKILSAGLDVFADEPRVPAALIAHDRVTLLPHVASASQFTRNAMGQLVIDNLTGWFERGEVHTPVPEAMPKQWYL